MPVGKSPSWCPECHANVYPDSNGYCYQCDTMTKPLPEHRKRWSDEAVKNEYAMKKMMDFYWERGEGAAT